MPVCDLKTVAFFISSFFISVSHNAAVFCWVKKPEILRKKTCFFCHFYTFKLQLSSATDGLWASAGSQRSEVIHSQRMKLSVKKMILKRFHLSFQPRRPAATRLTWRSPPKVPTPSPPSPSSPPTLLPTPPPPPVSLQPSFACG